MTRGRIIPKSSPPFHLIFSRRYLSASEDIEKIRRGLRFIFKVIKQGPLRDHVDFEYKHKLLDTDHDSATDEELEDIIRQRVETLYHPACTCRMAPEADYGVVDSHLRVYGVKGLRVADASVFPVIVSGHTVSFNSLPQCCDWFALSQAGACYAIGEHIADILKAEYGLQNNWRRVRAENPFQESLGMNFFPVYKSFHVLFMDMTLIDTCIVCVQVIFQIIWISRAKFSSNLESWEYLFSLVGIILNNCFRSRLPAHGSAYLSGSPAYREEYDLDPIGQWSDWRFLHRYALTSSPISPDLIYCIT